MKGGVCMHIAKYNRSALGHILQHCENEQVRAKRDNVDANRHNENYNLVKGSGITNLRRILKQVHCSKRKDVNIICSCVVSVPDNLPKGREREFFISACKFLSERYKSPCISACCHFNEPNSRPHLHFVFVPLVYDNKKNRYKVCAKEKITKQDLQTLHQDFQRYLKINMHLDLDILNGATANGNKTINELKADTLKKEISALQKKKSQLLNAIEQVLSR